MARATLQAPSRRKVSPVYVLLDHLREPEWRTLLLGEQSEFSQGYEAWRSRMEVARQKNLAGDILVLADETPTQALWLEAKRLAGNCLLKLQHFELALEQFDAALALEPDDKPSLEKRAVCLGRLGRHEEAREAGARADRGLPRRPRGLGAGRAGWRRCTGSRAGAIAQLTPAADARGRGGRAGQPGGSHRALPPGLHRRPVAPLFGHQLADAAPAAASTWAASRTRPCSTT